VSTPTCKVFFPAGPVALDEAARLLRDRTLRVARTGDQLSVGWDGGPLLRIRYARGPSVLEEARRIGGPTRHAAAMHACDARFEITFDDLNAVLDEVNTLMEIQMTLQEATGGLLFTAWNNVLTSS
jgi:hypothetical protein